MLEVLLIVAYFDVFRKSAVYTNSSDLGRLSHTTDSF